MADKIIDGDFKAWAEPELMKKSLVHLSDWEWGFRQLTNSKRPVMTPTDLKGMKIRTPPAFAYQAFVEAAGGLSLIHIYIQHSFSPTEFTQVNPAINRVLVRRAMALLDPRAGERVADMFCGLGNFTLPIARSGAHVLGVEGSVELVRRAAENSAANGLKNQVSYRVANLFETTPQSLAAFGHFDKMLIDPPREGAVELVNALGSAAPSRIVYVSCNPSTLARDAAILVAKKGYRLTGAGVVNMFPNTSHVESVALFDKE